MFLGGAFWYITSCKSHHYQGIVGCTITNVPPYGKSLDSPYKKWVFLGHNPQESLQNTIINTTGPTLLGVAPFLVP